MLELGEWEVYYITIVNNQYLKSDLLQHLLVPYMALPQEGA